MIAGSRTISASPTPAFFYFFTALFVGRRKFAVEFAPLRFCAMASIAFFVAFQAQSCEPTATLVQSYDLVEINVLLNQAYLVHDAKDLLGTPRTSPSPRLRVSRVVLGPGRG